MKKKWKWLSHFGDRPRRVLLIMKNILLLTLVFNFQVSASMLSQKKVTLNLNDATLRECIRAIENQTTLGFLYNGEELNEVGEVSISVTDKDLGEVLNTILTENGYTYNITNGVILIRKAPKVTPVLSSVQDKKNTVTGRVSDASGQPLVGVNVFVKGRETQGVITDVDGVFTIEIKDQTETIVFSYIGFNTLEVVANKPVINITLEEEINDLDEVVVTALGIKKQAKKVGFAVTEVKGEELAQQQVVNPVQSLQGQAAGLSVTTGDGTMFGSSKIQLRGVSVLNSSSNQPIFVVDGVIMDVGVKGSDTWGGSNSNDMGSILKNLDADNFESVSVLKGAAATALYGSRGINGAIIIKTKGADTVQKGFGVTIKQTLGIDHVYDQLDMQYEYGPGNYAPRADNHENNPFDTRLFKHNADGNPTIKGLGYTTLWGPKFDPSIQYEFWDSEYRPYAPVKDNIKDAFETGIMNSTHVSISGGNDKTRFFLSDTYTKRTGIYPNNKFSRNSLKLSASHSIADNLNVQANISITNSKPQNPNNSLGRAFIYGSWNNMYDVDEWGKREIAIAPHGGIPNSEAGDDYAYVPGNSIWFDYFQNSYVRNEDFINSQLSLNYSPFKWLDVRGEYYRVQYNVMSEQKRADRSYAQKGNGGYYKIEHNNSLEETMKLVATYNYDFTPALNINGILGVERFDQEKSKSSAETKNGLIVPGQYFIDNSKGTVKGKGSIYGTKRINSVYGTVSLDYQDTYFLEFTGRNDWSSALTYSDGSGNNSYFYPSVSFSWLSNQTINLPAWVDMTKFRLSWAKVGNDTGAYFLNSGYKNKSVLYDGNVIINENKGIFMDPNIKPEMKTSIEAGLDFRFLQNRFGIDFAWYSEEIENQIGKIGLDSYSGYKNIHTNIATLKNEGLELSFFFTPVRTQNWEWKSTVNWWTNETTLPELNEQFGGSKRIGGDTYSHFFTEAVAVEGGVYGELRSPQKQKTFLNEDDPNDPRNGKPLCKYSNGWRTPYAVQAGTSETVGNIQPDFEYSFNNQIRYKRLRFSFLIDGRSGGTVLSHENRYGTMLGQTVSSLYARDAAHGGLTFTGSFGEDAGTVYDDGVIPDIIFDENVTATDPSGNVVDISGMSMQEAVDQGIIDPVHASTYTYLQNSWGNGVINDGWVTDVEYVALRNINLNYSLSQRIAKKIGASELSVGLNIRNVCYLYNNMPNNVNPESVRGNSSNASYFIQSAVPYTRSYSFNLTAKF
ncbi:MAG: SusC/RagA family TonB-linked outer membrane protein [Carboxylicivirga sp.]|jgi:iron complex outermembrane receptor protein|nr:SusC/RagA family TonB-linked outer membrane protein [Carboxylicivirga sp.]